ncbi:hypothetical protein [Nitriliruptor alkaliphilus]|uniref:hypothetical protein n=1 Tax=Nitriliruptor alkaliphilus TaxID=427918 RepID=UPI0012EDB505|nr:hypothetical protein [Nitriliruptor alkaliphilus]
MLGLTACTADGDEDQAADELPVEVEGEVLDRREPDAAEEPDVDGEEDTDDDGPGDDGPGDEDGTAETDDPDAADEAAPPTSPAPTSPAPTSPAPTSPTPTSPTPTQPAPAEPAPTPAPMVLAAGPARSTGPVLDSDGVEWTVTSSTSVERGVDPPALTVATHPGDDAPRRQVACAAALEAPSDRGLVARGTLTVSLHVVGTDGAVQVLTRQRIELDVTLEPGRRLDLAASQGRTFDVADVRQVTCVAELNG